MMMMIIIVLIIYLGNSPPVWSPRTLYRVHSSPPLDPNPSQINPVISLISVFPTKILYASALSLAYYMRCASPVVSFSHPETSRPVLRPTQASCSFRSGVKRPGRAGNHSYAAITEVNNEGSYIFASPMFLHGVDRENVNFYCYPTLNKIPQDSLALSVL
jgi:hypothetical protein